MSQSRVYVMVEKGRWIIGRILYKDDGLEEMVLMARVKGASSDRDWACDFVYV